MSLPSAMSEVASSVRRAGIELVLSLPEDAVLIDCDDCVMRDLACANCVVTVLLGAPPGAVEVDDLEQRALAVLADSGLVPHLRLVPLGLPGGDGRPASAAS